MHGDLTAVCQFCYLRWTSRRRRRRGGGCFLEWERWPTLPRDACCEILGKAVYWSWKKKVFPVLCLFPCRRAFWRGRPLRTDSHSWYTSHIQPPNAVTGGYETEGEGGWGARWGKHPHLLLDHAGIRGAHACTVTDHRDVSPPDNPTVCDAVTRSCAVTFSQPRSVSANIRAEGKMSQR